jgi:regulator of sigma E protease
VKTIPIGGYVKITGMNPEEEVPPEHEAKAYYKQKVWKRIVVVAAGPAVNIVLAFLILVAVRAAMGTPEVSQSVEAIRTDSPKVRLGRSMRDWMGRMGIAVGGETARALRDQARRIAACSIKF